MTKIYNSANDVLEYLAASNRKISRSKLYRDIRDGHLLKTKGVFKKRDVDRYALGLKTTNIQQPATHKNYEETALKRQKAILKTLETENAIKKKRLAKKKKKYITAEEAQKAHEVKGLAIHALLTITIIENGSDICKALNTDIPPEEIPKKLMPFFDEAFLNYFQPMECYSTNKENIRTEYDPDELEDNEEPIYYDGEQTKTQPETL